MGRSFKKAPRVKMKKVDKYTLKVFGTPKTTKSFKDYLLRNDKTN